MRKNRHDGNVIHADFSRREISITIRVHTEILYQNDDVMLARVDVGLAGDTEPSYFLAHRHNLRIETVPVGGDV